MKKFTNVMLACALTATCALGAATIGYASDFDTTSDISVLSREDGSGTRGAFIELFGIEQKDADGNKVDNTTVEAGITNSTSVMMTSVANDEYAIGYISLGSLNDTVKAVKIDGAEASVDSVTAGDYKIVRPFNIVLKDGTENALAADFMNYVMSTEGQTVVTDNGYIAVAEAEYTSDMSEGKLVIGGSSSVSPVMEKLVEAYKAINTNAEIEIQTTDSTTGVTSALDGTYDIGMASRDLKDTETAEGAVSTTIAQDGIAVIVNNSNPVEELTSEQVLSVYTGETTSWADIAE